MSFLKIIEKERIAHKSISIRNKDLNDAINGIHKNQFILLGGEPKSAKSSIVDDYFVLGPILMKLEKLFSIDGKLDYSKLYNFDFKTLNFKIYKYSGEVNLIETIANYTAYLVFYKYNYHLNPQIILGRKKDENDEPIVLSDIEKNMITGVNSLLEIIMGVYDNNLNCIKEGVVTLIPHLENPTGLRNDVIKYAELYGKVYKKEYEPGKFKNDRYEPYNKDLIVLFIYDDSFESAI